MLAHIRNGSVIAKYTTETGFVHLENGDFVSPPVSGYVNGNDKVVPVIDVLDDTSSGPNVVVTKTQMVNSDNVTITTHIRNKTAQEIDDEAGQTALTQSNDLTIKLHKLELAGLFWLVNDVRARHSQAAVTVDQFLTNLDTFASQFSDQKFVDKMKSILKA